ncbi:hypothetical protein WA026_017665 [Henosepilachna vigintioctopunctata]|uniref:Uncharacterized protein n=1 Tax=Henosepilachna vigintioctopunctata TaxID=420089 RepID=A0AAW1UDE4_9CUCU
MLAGSGRIILSVLTNNNWILQTSKRTCKLTPKLRLTESDTPFGLGYDRDLRSNVNRQNSPFEHALTYTERMNKTC